MAKNEQAQQMHTVFLEMRKRNESKIIQIDVQHGETLFDALKKRSDVVSRRGPLGEHIIAIGDLKENTSSGIQFYVREHDKNKQRKERLPVAIVNGAIIGLGLHNIIVTSDLYLIAQQDKTVMVDYDQLHNEPLEPETIRELARLKVTSEQMMMDSQRIPRGEKIIKILVERYYNLPENATYGMISDWEYITEFMGRTYKVVAGGYVENGVRKYFCKKFDITDRIVNGERPEDIRLLPVIKATADGTLLFVSHDYNKNLGEYADRNGIDKRTLIFTCHLVNGRHKISDLKFEGLFQDASVAFVPFNRPMKRMREDYRFTMQNLQEWRAETYVDAQRENQPIHTAVVGERIEPAMTFAANRMQNLQEWRAETYVDAQRENQPIHTAVVGERIEPAMTFAANVVAIPPAAGFEIPIQMREMKFSKMVMSAKTVAAAPHKKMKIENFAVQKTSSKSIQVRQTVKNNTPTIIPLAERVKWRKQIAIDMPEKKSANIIAARMVTKKKRKGSLLILLMEFFRIITRQKAATTRGDITVCPAKGKTSAHNNDTKRQ